MRTNNAGMVPSPEVAVESVSTLEDPATTVKFITDFDAQ